MPRKPTLDVALVGEPIAAEWKYGKGTEEETYRLDEREKLRSLFVPSDNSPRVMWSEQSPNLLLVKLWTRTPRQDMAATMLLFHKKVAKSLAKEMLAKLKL